MKNKIIITIMAVLIFVSAYTELKAYAYFYGTLDSWPVILAVRNRYNHNEFFIAYMGGNYHLNWSDGFQEFTNGFDIIGSSDERNPFKYNSLSEAIGAAKSYMSSTTKVFDSGGVTADQIVVIKGYPTVSANTPTGHFWSTSASYEDFIKPKWYEKMWDDFGNFLGATGEGIVDFFGNIIDAVFGDDNEGGPISHAVTIRNPTLAPTPTPIPYTTVVLPKTDVTTGETYYETNYYYVNPSGTPIITGSPPINSPTNNGGGNGGTEYTPVNGQPYSIPKLDWLSSVDIDGTGYDGIDSIGDGMSSVDEIGSEYRDGMSAVQDATGTLPTDWLLLIGIVAAIPLLAGIVSRFLGG